MTGWLNKCHFGDVREVLRRMAADGVKVQTIVTSPPYWGLRSYLPAGHADKAHEIGSEPTLREFIDGMVEVFNLCRDVLADDGTAWVNMGDNYGDRKQLTGQPHKLAFALQDAGWWLRQDIVWSKPNPMPESIRDRCTKAHEYIFLLSKSERYFYDFDAMQEPVSGTANARRPTIKTPDGWATHEGSHGSFHRDGREKGATRSADDAQPGIGLRPHRKLAEAGSGTKNNTSFEAACSELTTMRNRRSVWTVPSEPFSGAHFATFPTKLIEPCILAGAPVGCIVLDPFFGSGTTGQVAQSLGRQFIGIELNEANEPLQRERLRQPGFVFEDAA